MKRNLFYGVRVRLPAASLAILLVLGLVLAGCASTGGGKSGRTLTITGIPSEYEGKIGSLSEAGSSSSTPPSADLTGIITNGEVRLLFKPFFPGKTFDIVFNIWNTEQVIDNSAPIDAFCFNKVAFVEGVAEAKYDGTMKFGIITLTGIPVGYEDTFAEISVGFGTAPSNPSGRGYVKNGTVTMVVSTSVPPPPGSGMLAAWTKGAYTKSETQDITVSLVRPNSQKTESLGYGVSQTTKEYDKFVFKAVQITEGKASLDFANGNKQ